MRKLIVTTIGLAFAMAWVQILESAHLAHCVDAYNFSVAVAVCTACSWALCATRAGRWIVEKPVLVCSTTTLSAICGPASVAFHGAGAAALLCCHVALTAPAMIAFGSRLGNLPFKRFFPLACAAGIIANATASLLSTTPAASAVITFAAAPLLCAARFMGLDGKQSNSMRQSVSNVGNGRNATSTPVLRGTAVVLCTTLVAASLFSGLVTSPIYANSQTAGVLAAAVSTIELLAVLVAGAFLLQRRRLEAKSIDILLQTLICITMLVMVAGLFLFSSAAGGTLTASVGIVMGAKQVIAVVAWVMFPQIAHASNNATRTYALLVLGAGTVYAPYLGAWLAKMSAPAFAQLTTAAVGLIALVAMCSIASVAFFATTRSKTGAAANAVWQPATVDAGSKAANSAAQLTGTGQLPIAGAFGAGSGHMPNTATVNEDFASNSSHGPTKAIDNPRGAATFAQAAPAHRRLSDEELKHEVQRRRQQQLAPFGLTEREMQIVVMLLDGQTMKGIAEELFITERTVKFHSKNAYEKIGVASKKELMQAFSDLPSPRHETLQPSATKHA